MSKISLIYINDDWIRLVIDNKSVYENHNISAEKLLSTLIEKGILDKDKTEIIHAIDPQAL